MKTVFKVLLLAVHIFWLKAGSFSSEEIRGMVDEHKIQMDTLYPSPKDQRFHEGYKFALYVSQSSEETFTKEAKTNIVRAVLFRGTGYGGVSKTVLVTDIERKAAILALSTVGLLAEVYLFSYAHDPLTDAHVKEAFRYFEMGQSLARELKAAHEKADQERQEEEAKAKAEDREPEGVQTYLQEFMEDITTHEPFEAIRCLKDYGYRELRKGTFSIEVSKFMGSEVNAKAPPAETPLKSESLLQIKSPNPVTSSTPAHSPFMGLVAGSMACLVSQMSDEIMGAGQLPVGSIFSSAVRGVTPGSPVPSSPVPTASKTASRRSSTSEMPASPSPVRRRLSLSGAQQSIPGEGLPPPREDKKGEEEEHPKEDQSTAEEESLAGLSGLFSVLGY